jgi:hypothetical protein
MTAARYGTTTITKADPGDLELYAVSTILNTAGDSGGLVWWAANETARLAVNTTKQWLPLAHANPDAAVAHLAREHERVSGDARRLGSHLHEALEDYAISGIRPAVSAEEEPFIDQFDTWLGRAQPDYEAAELTVFNRTYGYAGTLDAIAVIDGVRFLVDYKTSKKSFDKNDRPTKPYPDKAVLQLAAYAHAERAAAFRARRIERPFSPRYYALSAEELGLCEDMPAVDAGLIVHITPEHCAAYPFLIGDDAFEAFLHAIEVYRWVKHTSKDVMGSPLQLPEPVDADR